MQMAAEELDMPIEQTRLVEGDTDLCPDQGPTWTSLSVQVAGGQIRRAAATARHALLDLAADRLATSRDNLEVRDGIVRVRGGGGQITWGELVDGQIIDLAVDDDAQVKCAAEHRLVGWSLPRPVIPAKDTGTFMFTQNVQVPGHGQRPCLGMHVRPAASPSSGANEHRPYRRALAWVTATERPWRVTPAAVWTVSPHLHPTIGWLTNR
jgi:hypothetical protein